MWNKRRQSQKTLKNWFPPLLFADIEAEFLIISETFSNFCRENAKLQKVKSQFRIGFEFHWPPLPSHDTTVSLSSHLEARWHKHTGAQRGGGCRAACAAAVIANTQLCFFGGAETQISSLQGHKELICPSTGQTLINLCGCCLLPSPFIPRPLVVILQHLLWRVAASCFYSFPPHCPGLTFICRLAVLSSSFWDGSHVKKNNTTFMLNELLLFELCSECTPPKSGLVEPRLSCFNSLCF